VAHASVDSLKHRALAEVDTTPDHTIAPGSSLPSINSTSALTVGGFYISRCNKFSGASVLGYFGDDYSDRLYADFTSNPHALKSAKGQIFYLQAAVSGGGQYLKYVTWGSASGGSGYGTKILNLASIPKVSSTDTVSYGPFGGGSASYYTVFTQDPSGSGCVDISHPTSGASYTWYLQSSTTNSTPTGSFITNYVRAQAVTASYPQNFFWQIVNVPS